MALALSVESLDGLPDAIHSLYVEQDGKFVLDLDGGIPDVTGLKSALESERAIAKAEAKAKKELEARYNGVDPDKYKEFLEQAEKAEEDRLKAAGEHQKLADKQLELRDAAHKKQLEEKDNAFKAAELKARRMEEKALDGFLSAGLNGSGIHSFASDEAIADARKVFSLDENGDVVALDADGDPLFDDDGKSKLTISSYFKSEKLKARKPHWFETKGGGTGAQQYGATKNTKDLSHLPPIERLTAARKMAAKRT